jgi:phage gp29-like protein
MVQDAVIVLNDDESVSLLDISSKGTSSDLYSGIINTANAEVSKVILGQTLTTEIPNQGSYAAVEGHLKVRKDLVESDKKLTSQAMNILLAWMNLFNCFRTDPPVFHFFEEEDVHKDQAQRDKLLADQGVEFTPRYYQRAYNLREDEFTLRKDPLSHVTERTEPQSPNQEGVQP